MQRCVLCACARVPRVKHRVVLNASREPMWGEQPDDPPPLYRPHRRRQCPVDGTPPPPCPPPVSPVEAQEARQAEGVVPSLRGFLAHL